MEQIPFILGLTGGVGAGKSTVLDILKEDFGFYVIQADQTAKELMEPGMAGYEAVCRYLGPDILDGDGRINRPLMAEIIFGDRQKREEVDRLTHPLTWKRVMEDAHAHRDQPVVIEAAIPSKEFRDKCDEMWYLYTSRENRAKRLKASRGYSDEKIRNIMESQADEDTFRRFSDAVIDNNGTAQETKAQITLLLQTDLLQTNGRRPDTSADKNKTKD
ncbi:dephospho-CoA kinase [Lacrimispora sp. 210928-DFI.3.58]|uniref:dephospho-CoA kinase n=1 Tax=Lacrimispora sp. 210928-DFI.3.58 TaxID=2883214 RepID=UPI0015B50466|nr:dephospho-CoA kinase [Lacrimispora sp. 210928-DFI.3.58]MCB7320639.1 dephospho-CoA kinase [Lacrimispora sp. 210928-DFI.3.58]